MRLPLLLLCFSPTVSGSSGPWTEPARIAEESYYRAVKRNATAAGSHTAELNLSSGVSVFSEIYEKRVWGALDDGSGGSGWRSLPENARGAARIVEEVALKFNASRILDAPCGAMMWQLPLIHQLSRRFGEAGGGFSYVGVDVVPAVIERDRERWGELANVSFAVADIATTARGAPRLPSADLILCRDALMHLEDKLVRRALVNFACSDAAHLLITSQNSAGHPNPNRRIRTGGYFRLDLARPPYSLTPRRVLYENQERLPGFAMYLFERAELKRQVASIHIVGDDEPDFWPADCERAR